MHLWQSTLVVYSAEGKCVKMGLLILSIMVLMVEWLTSLSKVSVIWVQVMCVRILHLPLLLVCSNWFNAPFKHADEQWLNSRYNQCSMTSS